MKHQELNLQLMKIPQITALFGLTKIFATTFGETAGDALSMSMNLGYLMSTFIFAEFLSVSLFLKYHLILFMLIDIVFTIIASTTVGTTLADFVHRSLDIGICRWNYFCYLVLHSVRYGFDTAGWREVFHRIVSIQNVQKFSTG